MFKLITTIAALTVLTLPTHAIASPRENSRGTYQTVDRQTATQSAVTTLVYPGRITAIDFSSTKETITYLALGDPSRVVFQTDFPLDSGTAKTIFLKPIVPLKFPGATGTKVTNLAVKTRDDSGQLRLYNFEIVHYRGTPTHLGIQIVPKTGNNNSIDLNIGGGRRASLDEVEIGLRWAIAQGYTPATDPIVSQVRSFLAIARNQDLSLVEAAQAAGVDLAVITELARLAFESFPKPLIPSPKGSVTPQEPAVSPSPAAQSKIQNLKSKIEVTKGQDSDIFRGK